MLVIWIVKGICTQSFSEKELILTLLMHAVSLVSHFSLSSLVAFRLSPPRACFLSFFSLFSQSFPMLVLQLRLEQLGAICTSLFCGNSHGFGQTYSLVCLFVCLWNKLISLFATFSHFPFSLSFQFPTSCNSGMNQLAPPTPGHGRKLTPTPPTTQKPTTAAGQTKVTMERNIQVGKTRLWRTRGKRITDSDDREKLERTIC